jgi:hypothetical protein
MDTKLKEEAMLFRKRTQEEVSVYKREIHLLHMC